MGRERDGERIGKERGRKNSRGIGRSLDGEEVIGTKG